MKRGDINEEVWNKFKEKEWWIYSLIIAAISALVLVFWSCATEDNNECGGWLSGEFWSFVVFVFVFCFLFITLIVLTFLYEKITRDFWEQFAKRNGWRYQEKYEISGERGAVFKDVGKEADHMIEKDVDGTLVRIFTCIDKIQDRKKEHNDIVYSLSFIFRNLSNKDLFWNYLNKKYYLTVFEFRSSGSFPHIYLNRKDNQYSPKLREWFSLSVASEFKKKFLLYAPHEYEIEALQIFSPDTLNYLLETDLRYDVELVDGDVLFYIDGRIESVDRLKSDLEQITRVYNYLAPRLDRMKLHPIGDIPYYLR